jgi:hypothetical protein
MKFHVAVTEDALEALNARRKEEREREEEWIAARRKELILPGMSRRAAAAVRRDIRARVARMRRHRDPRRPRGAARPRPGPQVAQASGGRDRGAGPPVGHPAERTHG